MIHTALLCIAAVFPGQVSLRGHEVAPAGNITAVDAAGVHMGGQTPAAGSAPAPAAAVTGGLVIGWDRVRMVEGPFAAAAAKYLDTADRAWRARTRLERGDHIAAEQLFERLFEFSRDQAGPTAAVVAEGLLRCRIHRAAHVAAVEPWLSLLRAGSGPRSLHPEWAMEAGLPGVLDPQTGLVPALPPIWVSWPSIDAYARSTGEDSWIVPAGLPAAELRVAALRALYAQAARFEVGLPAMIPAVTAPDGGVQIVMQIVQSRIGNAKERESARAALRDRIKPPTSAGSEPVPAWLEAWCRAAIGRSLLLEADPEVRRQGIVELLHIPARFGSAHPYLAGVALAESSAALRALGDKEGADTLARELVRNYPSHPVSDWSGVRSFLPRPQAVLAPQPALPAPAELPPDPPQDGEVPDKGP